MNSMQYHEKWSKSKCLKSNAVVMKDMVRHAQIKTMICKKTSQCSCLDKANLFMLLYKLVFSNPNNFIKISKDSNWRVM